MTVPQPVTTIEEGTTANLELNSRNSNNAELSDRSPSDCPIGTQSMLKRESTLGISLDNKAISAIGNPGYGYW